MSETSDVRVVSGDHDSIVQGKKSADTVAIINEIITGSAEPPNHVAENHVNNHVSAA